MAEAIKNAKRSSTRKGRGPKAADVKGVQGHTLAQSIILAAIKSGERVVQEQRSRKDTLRLLEQFRDNADHIAFRQDLEARLNEVKADAEKAKLSLNAYCEANPVAASIRAECSLWVKMSSAVERGFSGTLIDYDSPWASISKGATAHLDNMRNSTGTSGDQGGAKLTNAGPKQRKGKAGRKAKPVLEQAKQFVKDTLTNAPKDNRNLAEIVGLMLVDATAQEIKEVAAVVEKAYIRAKKSEEAAKAAAEKAAATASKKAPAPDYDPATQSKLRDGTIVTPEAKPQAKTGKARAKAKA